MIKTRSIMDGDLGFTILQTVEPIEGTVNWSKSVYKIYLTVVAGVVVDEPEVIYAGGERDTLAVFRALAAGLVSRTETLAMTEALRMTDTDDDDVICDGLGVPVSVPADTLPWVNTSRYDTCNGW